MIQASILKIWLYSRKLKFLYSDVSFKNNMTFSENNIVFQNIYVVKTCGNVVKTVIVTKKL